VTAIQQDEILWYLANPNGGAGFQGVSTPGNSLGKYMSTTQVYSTVPLDDVFLDITGAQNAGGQVDYQCMFMWNNTISGNTMHAPYVWMPSQFYTYGGATMAVGVDPTGPTPYNSSTQQAVQINTNTSAPAGVSTWYGPNATATSGLLVPDILPGYCIGIWLQRTATDSPPLAPQSFALQVTFASNA
jgi:hypothetical protein